jgi:hypothetical protein
MVRVTFEPAELTRLMVGPASAPVAGASPLWVSNTDSDLFHRKATGAFYCLTTSYWFWHSSLRSRAQASSFHVEQATQTILHTEVSQHYSFTLQLFANPTSAPSGEVPLCMVHTTAQEASRRTTPARALTHAVAPSMDRTTQIAVTPSRSRR